MKQTERAFQLYRQLVGICQTQTTASVDKGRLLYILKKDNLWKQIFRDYTWNAFIANPELQGTSTTNDFRARKVYKFFIIDLGLKEKEIYGINILLLDKLVGQTNQENVIEWLSNARELSVSDFNRLFDETFKGKKNPVDCGHEKVKEDFRRVCESCGEKLL